MNPLNTIREWIEVSYTQPFIFKFPIIVFLINLWIALIMTICTLLIFNKNKKIKRNSLSLNKKISLFYLEILTAEIAFKKKDIQIKFDEKFHKSIKNDFELLIIELGEIIQNNPLLKFHINFVELLKFLLAINPKALRVFSKQKVNKIKIQKAFSILYKNFNYDDSKINLLQLKPYTNKNQLFKALNFSPNKSLTEWDFLVIKDYYSNFDSKDLPCFASWVESTYIHTQKICFLKLIAAFNQYDSLNIFDDLLNSSNENIRKITYHIIGKLKYKDIENKLFLKYSHETEVCKKEIMKTILNISSNRVNDFLKKSYNESDTENEKKTILETLYLYSEDGKIFLKEKILNLDFIRKVRLKALAIKHR